MLIQPTHTMAFPEVVQVTRSSDSTKVQSKPITVLDCKAEMQQIKSFLPNCTPTELSKSKKLRFEFLASHQYAFFFQKFFAAMTSLFLFLHLTTCAKWCEVRRIHWMLNQGELKTLTWPSLLVSSRNVHQIGTEDVYLSHDSHGNLLCSSDGVCYGMSQWFSYLYLKFGELNPEVPKQEVLSAVTKLFEEGAPKVSALLQKSVFSMKPFFTTTSKRLFLYSPDLLKGNIEKQLQTILKKDPTNKEAQAALEAIQSGAHESDLVKVAAQVQTAFYQTKPGIYLVKSYRAEDEKKGGHGLNYIKISDDEAYIFDPNYGLLEFKGGQSTAKTFMYFTKYFKGKGPFELKRRALPLT